MCSQRSAQSCSRPDRPVVWPAQRVAPRGPEPRVHGPEAARHCRWARLARRSSPYPRRETPAARRHLPQPVSPWAAGGHPQGDGCISSLVGSPRCRRSLCVAPIKCRRMPDIDIPDAVSPRHLPKLHRHPAWSGAAPRARLAMPEPPIHPRAPSPAQAGSSHGYRGLPSAFHPAPAGTTPGWPSPQAASAIFITPSRSTQMTKTRMPKPAHGLPR